MFPLGLLAMANHAPSVDRSSIDDTEVFSSNMKLDWYFFDDKDRSVMEENIGDLLGVLPFPMTISKNVMINLNNNPH